MGHPRRAAWVLAAAVLVAAVVALVVALSGSDNPRTLDEAEAKRVLQQLPYEIHFRPTPVPPHADGAVAGRVIGPGGTAVRFGVSDRKSVV